MVVVILTYLITLKWPFLKNIIWVAAILRITTAFIHFFIFNLPDGNLDALKFENYTWYFSQLSISDSYFSFKSNNLALTFTWVLSFFYRLFGRSPLLLQSIGVFFGILNVVLVYKLAILLYPDKQKAKQSALILALFPTVILYSVLILREVYVMLFFVLSFIYIVKWINNHHLLDGFLGLIFYIPLYYLHGTHVIGAFFLFLIILINTLISFIKRFNNGIFGVPHFFLLFFTPILIGLTYSLVIDFKIPYLGKLEDIFTFSRILYQNKVTDFGGSVYPKWLSPNSLTDFFLLIIPRLLYLLFSPFIWDLRAINHLLGFVDGLMYIFIFYWLIRGVLKKKRKQIISTFYIILLPLLIAYSWGVGNFGTALRHRVKFVPVLIALSSVYLPKIVLLNKSKRVSVNRSESNKFYFEGG
jgi:hypothetical protein